MERRKNEYVNLLKGISCIIVIFLHCPFPGFVGDGIIYGLRFPVPIFFMVSGYFGYVKNVDWVLDKAKYILKLLIFSEIFYGIWTIVRDYLAEGVSAKQTLEAAFAGKSIIQVLLCGTLFNGVLWYLYAMFWTWIFVFLHKKFNWGVKSYILIPLLLGVQILGRFYIQNNYDISTWVFLFRNAFTFGIPFVLLGTWIAQYEEGLKQKISLKKNIGIIAVGLGLIVVEFVAVGQYMDLHVSTVIVSIGLFLLAVRMQKTPGGILNIFACIGKKWYTWIYLSHIFFVDVLDIIYNKWGFAKWTLLGFLRPVLVCVLACVCAEGIDRLHKICILEKNNNLRKNLCRQKENDRMEI